MTETLKSELRNRKRSPRGFTLVELLIVIAIIGILVSLLLPAVQSAREAARRMQCSNNLKQLGLALLNYENTHKIFPPGSNWRPADSATIDSGNHNRYSENWVILILPFFEEQNLFDKFDLKKYITDTANAAARGTPLNTMRCPSDPHNDQPFNGSTTTEMSAVGDGWARGNYAANAGLGAMNSPSTCGNIGGVLNCAALPSSPGWKDSRLRGLMGANSAVSIAEIRDGTSKSILVAEVRAGVNASDPRGLWAMSGGPSSLWGHGSYMGDANGPNASGIGGDNVPSCNTLVTQGGCSAWNNCPFLEKLGMTCYPLHGNQEVCRSPHLGGVFVAMADGSVHFLGDFIDTSGNVTANPPQFSVWDRLNLSADAQPIDASAY